MATTRISAAINFAFRDKELSKGSGIKNGFVDLDENQEPIVIKRPALTSPTNWMPAVAHARGLYYRKNTVALMGPSDYNNNNDVGDFDTDIYTFRANYKGQFLCGGHSIAYAENNNCNNWIEGKNLTAVVANDVLRDAAHTSVSDEWLTVTELGYANLAGDDDLTSWTQSQPFGASASNRLYSCAIGDGIANPFVVVGDNALTANSDIASGANGSTWAVRANPTNQPLYGVATSLSYFTAVGLNSAIIYSADAITWTQAASPVTAHYYAVAYNKSANTWIAVGTNGTIIKATGATPTTWSNVSPGGSLNANLNAVYAVEAYNNNGTTVDFIVAGSGGALWYTTNNGTTWQEANFPNEDNSPPSNIAWARVGPLAVKEYNPSTTLNNIIYPHAHGFVVMYANTTTSLGHQIYCATSMDGINWYVGNDYNHLYAITSDRITTVNSKDTSIVFNNEMDFYEETFGALNSVTGYRAKAYFAEQQSSDNSVMGILAPGEQNINVGQFHRGGMAFCVNNSPPIFFHGYGQHSITVPAGDSSVMTYPFNYIDNTSEYLVHGMVSMDNYFFMTTNLGNIYHCENNNWRKWPALNKISAQLEGDAGRGITKHHNNILAFGRYTAELFYNAGNTTGSTLSRREDIRYNVGLAFPNTLENYSDVIFFVGDSKDLGKGVYTINNFQLKKISNYYIDSLINNYIDDHSDDTVAFATSLETKGHVFYILTIVGTDPASQVVKPKTLVYDAAADLWYNWYITGKSPSDNNGAWYGAAGFDAIDALAVTTSYDNTKYCMTSDGFVYTVTSEAYQDQRYDSFSGNTVANTITSVVQFPKLKIKDMPSTNRVRHKKVTYMGDRASLSTLVSIDYSDNDYQSWSTAQTVDISTDFPRLNNLGMGRMRAYRATYADNYEFRFTGLELNIQPTSH